MNRFQIVDATIRAEMAKPYAYGSADCFFLGLAVVDAINGSDMAGRYRGRYRTLKGAQRALRREGHATLVTFFDGHLPQIAPALARLGDVAVLNLNGAEHVAVCLGERFVTKTETGRSLHPLGDCIAAFRVG